MAARISSNPRRFKIRVFLFFITLLGLVSVLIGLGLVRSYISSIADQNLCYNRVSGIQCSETSRTCRISNALVDAARLSRRNRGAIQFQCDIMQELHFPSPIINLIRQPSQICSEFENNFTVIVMMEEAERGDLGANLALMEGAFRTCLKSKIDPSNARVIVDGNKFMALWRNLFQVVSPDVQLCLSEAVILREPNLVPNLAFERQLFLSQISTNLARTRIGFLMPDCSPSKPCEQLDPILAQLNARSISVEPIYINDVTIASLNDISDLGVLIAPRSRLDGIALFLPATSTLIEVSFDDELRTISRYNVFADYHRIRFSNAKDTASEIKKRIPKKFYQIAPLPAPIAGKDRRQQDPNNPRLAVIVPFRDSFDNTTQGLDRGANLVEFAGYMNNFLTAAGRDFEIIVIEQEPGVLFNKAALFNIGYDLVKHDFAYMALHDVDQLPIDPRNDYRMPEKPTHLCSASSQYGWKPAYATMVGGVLLLRMEHFKQINGLSNHFWGWGMEDDDLYFRLSSAFGNVDKLDPNIGQYRALAHRRVQELDTTPLFFYNRRYLDYVLAHPSATKAEGLNTIKYQVVQVTKSELGFTKYTVRLDLDWMPTSLDQVPEVDPWMTYRSPAMMERWSS